MSCCSDKIASTVQVSIAFMGVDTFLKAFSNPLTLISGTKVLIGYLNPAYHSHEIYTSPTLF